MEDRAKIRKSVIALATVWVMTVTLLPMNCLVANAKTMPAKPSATLLTDEEGMMGSDGRVGYDADAQWDCIYFGNYPQTYSGGNTFKKEPIKWRVLSINGSNALLMSDKILDCCEYNEESKEVTWNDCTMRSWLNDTSDPESFIKTAFTDEEQKAINESSVDCYNYQNELFFTEDKIYIPSTGEVSGLQYGFATWMLSTKTRQAEATDYAAFKGVYDPDDEDLRNSWWLRSPGKTSTEYAMNADSYGNIDECETILYNTGVRPMLWLDLSKSNAWSYAGVSVAQKYMTGNATDGSLVINSDTTLKDLNFKGNVYVSKGATLTLSGEANITGNLYIFGTVNNKENLTVGDTIYCLHYGASMSAGGNYDYGYFNDYGSASAENMVVQDSYLSVKIPDVSTGSQTKPVNPPTGDVKPPTKQDPPTATVDDQKEAMFYGVSDKIKTYGDKPFNLGIRTSSSGAISYSSDDHRVATVDAKGVVTIHGTGATCITITTAENDAFLPGEEYVLIKVKPKKMVAPKLKSKKKNALTVKWKKDTRATGYQVVVAKDKKFKKVAKTATIKKNKTVSKTFKKLKKKKTYYVRIRPYKNTEFGRIYGNYSKAKKCKIK